MKVIFSLYETLSAQLLHYNEGDLLGIMDIQENCKVLSEKLISYPLLSRLCDSISDTLENLFKGKPFSEVNNLIVKPMDLLVEALHMIEESDDKGEETPEGLFGGDLAGEIRAFLDPSALPKGEGKNTDQGAEEAAITQVLSTDFFGTFSAESKDRLIRAQDIVLDLDSNFDSSGESVNELFRIFHTIKGECGFINLASMGHATHDLESLLDLLRQPGVQYDSKHTDILLQGIDLVKRLLECLEEGRVSEYLATDISPFQRDILELQDLGRPRLGKVLVDEGKMNSRDVDDLLRKQQDGYFNRKLGQIAVDEGKISSEEIDKALKKQRAAFEQKTLQKRDSIINVRASQINILTDLIQELWIAENQIEDERMRPITKITSQIQNIAMGLRTVKVNFLYTNLRRLFRDLSRKLEKDVDAQFVGSELEIDRNLVENLKEPMMHIIRNSLDHGIESKDERIKAGKKPTGSVVINTERRGNRIIISVRDDGKGLDRDVIAEKAIARGMITGDEVRKLPNSKVYELILSPGFSTADTISDVSGRGVGMDVVNSMIEDNQGKLTINTEKGQYTEFLLQFPLNVAIIDGMVVKTRDNYFIIPVSEIVECLQFEGVKLSKVKNSVEVINIRGEIIPVMALSRIFQEEIRSTEREERAIVIVSHESKKIALLVMDIIEKAEVAIKPLGRKFADLRGISSGTIFSGGKIGFILNVEQLVTDEAIMSL